MKLDFNKEITRNNVSLIKHYREKLAEPNKLCNLNCILIETDDEYLVVKSRYLITKDEYKPEENNYISYSDYLNTFDFEEITFQEYFKKSNEELNRKLIVIREISNLRKMITRTHTEVTTKNDKQYIIVGGRLIHINGNPSELNILQHYNENLECIAKDLLPNTYSCYDIVEARYGDDIIFPIKTEKDLLIEQFVLRDKPNCGTEMDMHNLIVSCENQWIKNCSGSGRLLYKDQEIRNSSIDCNNLQARIEDKYYDFDDLYNMFKDDIAAIWFNN